MAAYKARGISLKTAPFMEADKLVTLFTREHGKVRAIAKGARRVPSRFGGRVEPFTYADYLLAKGRNLDIVSQCQVRETFQSLREDPEGLPSGLYMLKLVDAGTVEGQHHPELFDLLLDHLLKLKAGGPSRRLAKSFEREFVVIEGIYQEGVDPQYSLSDHVGRDLRQW
ncbi:MAG: DNA repair protein RecO [Candidatus Saganbacteria bacterium]|nr:DNA repair protein RecO [Candidatus Saganbacteria bacterium]